MKNENTVIADTCNNIKESFKSKNTNELIQVSFYFSFRNSKECAKSGRTFFDYSSNLDLLNRKQIEQNYYTYLYSGFIHRIVELDFMTDLNLFDSRRLVFTNPDCMSFIQVLFRDKIYLTVHFRSSHFEDALPSDIEFITSIPEKLLDFLSTDFTKRKNKNFINSIAEYKNKEVQVLLTFGSLHKN